MYEVRNETLDPHAQRRIFLEQIALWPYISIYPIVRWVQNNEANRWKLPYTVLRKCNPAF